MKTYVKFLLDSYQTFVHFHFNLYYTFDIKFLHAFKREPKYMPWSPDKLNVVNGDAFLDGTT